MSGPLDHPAYERVGELVGEVGLIESALLETRDRLKEVFEANAEMLDALKLVQWWRGLPGEDANAIFERIGEAFRKDTGFLRPGKSYPMAESYDSAARDTAWNEWRNRKNSELDRLMTDAIAKATSSSS